MGYTQYFTQKKTFTDAQWVVACTMVKSIIDLAIKEGIKLCSDFEGKEGPLVNDHYIRFNGVDDESCETFILYKNKAGFNFCKTRGYPYDDVVTAILTFINTTWPDHFDIGSDGGPGAWKNGLGLAQRALPELAADLRVPIE